MSTRAHTTIPHGQHLQPLYDAPHRTDGQSLDLSPQHESREAAFAYARRLRPIGARVIIVTEPEPETTASGLLYVPEIARARPTRGTVVAVGPGRQCSGAHPGCLWPAGYRHHSGLKEGDVVYFTEYADMPANDTKLGDHRVVGVCQEEILLLVEMG